MAMKETSRTAFAASVDPRPRRDGTTAFDVRYRLNGASKRLSFDRQKDAEKWAGILRKVGPEQALAFLNLSTTPGTPTVEAYLETYIATKSGIEPRTIEHYRTYMRLHIAPVLGHLPLDAVSKTSIASWVNLMAGAGASSKSIKNRHGFLSAMFQNAVDDGILTGNPCSHSRLPETERREMTFLSSDEYAVLLSYIPERHQPLVQLLAATGMRWGEVTALRRGDFDLDARTVSISRAWKASDAGWYIGPPKTKRSRRTVELPPNLIPIIRPAVESAVEYVFTNAHGKPIRQQNFWEAVWAPARRLANGQPPFPNAKDDPTRPWIARARSTWDGMVPNARPINKWPRVHDLRHSSVAWLLGEGVAIDVIARRLGHESTKTTSDVYGHISPDRLWDAADRMGVALSGAMPSIEE